jgi:hypothetical protein
VPLNTTGLNAAANGIATAADRISAHTADPGSTGTSEVAGGSYARQTTTWAVAAGGSRVGSQITASIPAGTTITHWGLWSSGGTFHGGFALAAPEEFGSAGTWNHTPTLTASVPA